MFNNVTVHLKHMFVDNPWILMVEHIRQILQHIPRRYSSRYAKDLLDQLSLKFMMGLGPRAKTININSFSQLLGYNIEHEQNQKVSKSRLFAFNKTVASGCLMNRAGVLACIYSMAHLAFLLWQSK